MIKNLILLIGVLTISRIAMVAQPVMFEKYEFENLESRVDFSQNKQFVFVRVPAMAILDYEREVVRSLHGAGRSVKDVGEFQRSKRYRDALRIERESRKLYPETGLYDSISRTLLKRFPDYPIDCERIFVSDSGEYLVAINLLVLSENNLKAEAPMSDLRKTPQPGLFVGWTRQEQTSCVLPLSVLIRHSDKPSINTVGFKWAKDEVAFDDKARKISLKTLDEATVTLDLETCSPEGGVDGSTTPPGSSGSCWTSVAVVLGLFLKFSAIKALV
ncbi:MAG: hypothetical protein IPO41_13680 [Acidobacteria bacterium]|nr:hypothetical protein [Acidobacteriota bacterium]